MAYDHGAFRVRDLEAAVRFYTEKLGFQFLFYSGSEEAGEKGPFWTTAARGWSSSRP